MTRLFFLLIVAIMLEADADLNAQEANPKNILFSIATINDSLPVTNSRPVSKPDALVMHEDDWRQFEAVSATFRVTIDEELGGIRRIRSDKSARFSSSVGYTEIHVRKRLPAPFSAPPSFSQLLKAMALSESAMSSISLRQAGTIEGGFCFRVGNLRI